MISITSNQQLKELQEQYGEAFFTFRKKSVELIQNFNDKKCEKIGRLFQQIQYIFIMESSATIGNPSDEILLEYFISMEIAKLFDTFEWVDKNGKIQKNKNAVTILEFNEINEINEILKKYKENIKSARTYRDKFIAHSDYNSSKYGEDILPTAFQLEMLREFSGILFKILYLISRFKKEELGGHDILIEIHERLQAMRKFYSDENNLDKILKFEVVDKN